MTARLPFLTVVVPVRNEARFIATTLGQLLSQDYPEDRHEILVVDGMSDDGTRDIVQALAAAHPRLRLLDNPRILSGAGRNVGFRAGLGDCFLVVDGHCHIPDDKLLRNVAACFAETGAHCLGRPQPLDPPDLTPFQRSVALARASRLGHGGDSLIYGDFEGYASPVSNGAAYRREVFERVGYVDEDFDACEDVEFNHRVEQAGLVSYTSPRLTVRYYPRESLGGLLRQMRRYGRGRRRLLRRHPGTLSLTGLAPAVFAAGVLLALVLLLARLAAGPQPLLDAGLSLAGFCGLVWLLAVGAESLRLGPRHGLGHVLRLPPIFFVIHFGLGLGFLEECLSWGASRRGLGGEARA